MRRATARGSRSSPALLEGALQLHGRMQAAVGAVEGGQEAVALEPDDAARRDGRRAARRADGGRAAAAPSVRAQLRRDGAGVGDVAEHQRERPVGRAEPADGRRHRLERRGDHVDRGQVCRRFHVEAFAPATARAYGHSLDEAVA